MTTLDLVTLAGAAFIVVRAAGLWSSMASVSREQHVASDYFRDNFERRMEYGEKFEQE